MTEGEARELAQLALETSKARGCTCNPAIGVEARGRMGGPTCHIHHEEGCKLEPGHTLILGQPGGAELN